MKALVVVNYQNDYVVGPMSTRFTQMIEGNICKRIEATLEERGSVFFVVDYFTENYLQTSEGKRVPVKHCIRGTAGVELFGKIALYLPRGFLIRKNSPGSKELLDRLKTFEEIEFCGVDTNVDILANAIIARVANPEAVVTIRQNCIATRNSQLAEETLDVMRGLGVEIV
jgi:nicotinamidase-related amidase